MYYHLQGSPQVETRYILVRDPVDRAISTFYWNWYLLPYRMEARANLNPAWIKYREQILQLFPKPPVFNRNPTTTQLWPILEDRFAHFVSLLPEMIEDDPHTQPQAIQQQTPYGGSKNTVYVPLEHLDNFYSQEYGVGLGIKHNVMPYHKRRSRRRLITPAILSLLRQLYAVDFLQWDSRTDKYAK